MATGREFETAPGGYAARSVGPPTEWIQVLLIVVFAAVILASLA